MHDNAAFVEGIHAAFRAIEQLIGDNEVARRDMLAQAAHGADRNHPLDAQTFQGPDVGAHWKFGRRNAMPAPVTRQKSHRDALDFADRNYVAGIAKGSLHRDLFHVGHALHLIESAAADYANLRLWHQESPLRLSVTIQIAFVSQQHCNRRERLRRVARVDSSIIKFSNTILTLCIRCSNKTAYILLSDKQMMNSVPARAGFTGILQNADERLISKEEGEHNNG